MATNADIAKAAGVSPAIVSRIVNGDKTLRVSAETRARVLRHIQEMDYSPNVAARSLKASSTGVIALIVHDLTSSVYAEIIAGAHEAALAYGKAVLVGEANESASGQSHLEDLVAGRGVDGIILQGAGTRFDRTLERAARHGVPTVLLQAGDPLTNRVVRLDDEAAGRVATEHLLSLGHTHIGYIGVADELLFSGDRKHGWQRALADAGIEPQDGWSTDGGNKFAPGADAIRELLRRDPQLTGVVVANVASAIGVSAALQDLGKRIPDDFSMIAVHDIPLADYLRPALTVIRMPLRQLGSVAIEEVTGGGTTPGVVCVDGAGPELIERASTAPVRRYDAL
ncbi:MAG: LacI family DNA-binding transcriptional regulator [Pseudomonadota bacterium]